MPPVRDLQGCVLCNEPMYPSRVQDPRNRDEWVYGWKCQCKREQRADSLPQLTIRDDNGSN